MNVCKAKRITVSQGEGLYILVKIVTFTKPKLARHSAFLQRPGGNLVKSHVKSRVGSDRHRCCLDVNDL